MVVSLFKVGEFLHKRRSGRAMRQIKEKGTDAKCLFSMLIKEAESKPAQNLKLCVCISADVFLTPRKNIIFL